MKTLLDSQNCLQESLYDLRQDTRLLQLAIRGAAHTMDPLTWECLLRLTDYLQQHVNDVCFLCKRIPSKAEEHSIA